MKNYTKEKLLELPRKTAFPDYKMYTCLKEVFQDFILKLDEVINLLCLNKKLRLKASSKPWIDSILGIRKRNKLYKKYKKIWFED